ncbi:MAG: deoxyribonuclease [Desulfurococcales archaeon ex4484_204]|nr:MAG: deoxyribonuclease [Desulfurococcales archaeon ex4484_204]
MTRYRNYRNPYSVDVTKFSIYPRSKVGKGLGKVDVGDEFNITVRDMDSYGRGVGSYRNYEVVVLKAVPGERVRVRVLKVRGNTIQASVVRRLEEPRR